MSDVVKKIHQRALKHLEKDLHPDEDNEDMEEGE
jgi:hypothetical protein